ncbi:MAG: hypothetical protein KatS3mg008_1820 [Acidimicrobiales bacterium]|nr:MAG: hypothetical protein KatS3mg008_1820 [Acidimicrobiales bacterium]
MSSYHSYDDVPQGNTYDKYGSRNPVTRLLMRGFARALTELLEPAAPQSILDVGCGEGFMSRRLAEICPDVVGLDLGSGPLVHHWIQARGERLRFVAGDAARLPFKDASFDCVTALEVLEHVERPLDTLREIARVARRYAVFSVPREPLWRILNMARGAYLRDLGNTPGHINHWSKTAFVALASSVGVVEEVRSPLPWTMVRIRVDRARPSTR